MIQQLIERYLFRSPLVATCLYCGAVVLLLLATYFALADLYERQTALAATNATRDQLAQRKPHAAPADNAENIPAGSPLLEGPTITVAGAGLLQRVTAAVTRVGGTELSSQVDLQGPQSNDGFVSVTVNCEVNQVAMQQLLYDLESGMPFLFVDQLTVQTLANNDGRPSGRLRIVLAVSGQWQGVQ
jgi:general secretion pathway protein M